MKRKRINDEFEDRDLEYTPERELWWSWGCTNMLDGYDAKFRDFDHALAWIHRHYDRFTRQMEKDGEQVCSSLQTHYGCLEMKNEKQLEGNS